METAKRAGRRRAKSVWVREVNRSNVNGWGAGDRGRDTSCEQGQSG